MLQNYKMDSDIASLITTTTNTKITKSSSTKRAVSINSSYSTFCTKALIKHNPTSPLKLK